MQAVVSRPVRSRGTVLVGLLVFVLGVDPQLAGAQPGLAGKITFEDAARRALASRPELRRFALALQVAEARRERASLAPPLEFAADLEGAFGTGEYQALDGAELSISLTSLFERGGKRAARVGLAVREQDLLTIEQRIAALDLLAETGRRFVDTAVAEEHVRLATIALEQATQTVELVTPRVRAARSPRTELLGAEIECGTASVALASAQRDLLAAQAALAEQWGDVDARPQATLALLELPAPRTYADLVVSLEALPDLARFATTARLREAELQLARADSVADWRWTLGVRRYQEPGDQALIVGFSIPLDAARRNAAAVREAELAGEIVAQDHDASTLALRTLLFKQLQALDSARASVRAITDELLPRANESLALTDRGYRIGRFPYRELALAKNLIVDLELRRLDAAARFHRARIEIERLTGAQLTLIAE